MHDEVKEIDKQINYTKLARVHKNGKIFYFNTFRRLGHFIRSIYFGDFSLKQPINRQNKIDWLLRDLEYYKQKILTK